MNSEIYHKLSEIFMSVLDEDEIEIKPETVASDIASWDSLAHVRLMLAIERAFQCRFSAAENANLKNVGELVALIEKKSVPGSKS